MDPKPSLAHRLHLDRLGVRARIFLLFYGVVIFSMSLVGYTGYHAAAGAYRDKALELVSRQTADVALAVTEFLRRAPADLHFIANHYALQQHLYWKDLGVGDKEGRWLASAMENFGSFLASREYLYKVRFLDVRGIERIKIANHRDSGRLVFEGGSDLQDRGQDPTFQAALALERDAIYVSPPELSQEHGKIERPHIPVLHVAQPVVGPNGVKYGVAILDVYADAFLGLIGAAEERGGRYLLISADGNYYRHWEEGKAWGHLLGRPANFQDDAPEAFAAVRAEESGAFELGDRVVSFQRIYPNAAARGQYWFLVGSVGGSEALAQVNEFINIFAAVFLTTLLLVAVLGRVTIAGVMRPLGAVTRQLERLGRGEVAKEEVAYGAADEIGRMLASTSRVMENMGELVRQVDTISAGDYGQSVPVLSADDRLGYAIDNMTRTLRDNRLQNERQQWFSGGVNQLAQLLSGDLDAQPLAERAVAFVGRYLEAGHGVLYVYDETAPEAPLILLGSYMFTERDIVAAARRLGEGAIGQVARERKPILLRNIPRGEAAIEAGTAVAPPLNTYTYPLLYEERLYGVIELASFLAFDEDDRHFLEESGRVIAGYLHSALQRQEIRRLLAAAEGAAREARERSEAVGLANRQLEEQQRQLQRQTVELQEANAQMEEQQQQLQQQAEELQEANAQMEEQQQQLQQQTRELEHKNRDLTVSQQELDRRARELELANQYKSEFLANMSHELRTPLNSIILLAKMLAMNEEGRLGGEEVKRAGVIHHAGEELLRLINDILDLSKIEAGKMEVHYQPLASADLIAEFKDLFAETARAKGLELRLTDNFNDEWVTDRDKVGQILRNLLSNAVKFTKEGHVELRVGRGGRDPQRPLVVTVSDTGIGIPEEKQKLVFEAFQQVDGSTSREYGGTGLGLSISRRFAELLGGTLELESRPGEGSRFTLRLPLAPPGAVKTEVGGVLAQSAPAPVPAPAVAVAVPPEPVHDDRANLKSSDAVILVIDDDTIFAEAVAALNRRLGYKTLIATGGGEGLRMAKTYHPRGILLDLGLPDMAGGEVLRELKATRELRGIPVYVVSARDRDDSLLRAGSIGYLQKPVDDRQLGEAEAAILARAGGAKRIVVVEGGSLDAAAVHELLGDDGVTVAAAAGCDVALERLAEGDCDLLIVDLVRPEGEPCRALLEALGRSYPELPLLLYGDRDLSSEEEAELRHFTDSIILKTPHARQRMLENIEHFLRGVPGERDTAAIAGVAAGEKRLAGRRILVVDDDPRNLFVITSALESQGAKVANSLNGRKALELLQREPFDLIFMDIMMPEMDGYQTIKRLKADERLRRMPVVALTAKALKADKEKALAAGADDYLSKPVDYEVLVNMAKVWCEGGR